MLIGFISAIILCVVVGGYFVYRWKSSSVKELTAVGSLVQTGIDDVKSEISKVSNTVTTTSNTNVVTANTN